MADELGDARHRSPRLQHSERVSLAVVSPRAEQEHLYVGERTWLACQGTIRFASSSLQVAASRSGAAAAIASAFERRGKEALGEIRGVFALAVFNRVEKQLLLAVDRMGIHTLQYCLVPRGLVFGSTNRSIKAHPAARRPIDLQAVFNYLFFHVVPSPRGIFEGYRKLQPGEYLLLDDGKLETGFYWQPEYVSEGAASESELASEFKESLRAAVRRALDWPGQKGAFLSGGTDSSTVAGLMAEIQGEPARAYSVGFDVDGYDELAFARIAATRFGLNHRESYLTPQNVVETVPLLARAYDEPFGNASVLASFHCAKMACADGVETLLGGDGGDELFGGNARYAKQRAFDYYWKVPAILRAAAIEPIVFALSEDRLIFPFRKLQSYVRQARIPLPDRLETYNFLIREPVEGIFHSDFLAATNPSEPIELLRAAYNRAIANDPLNRILYLELKYVLADNDLRKVTRSCEIAGINVLYPLLDDEVVEFSTRVPGRLKVKGLKLRYFFKRALRDFLPREILEKQKHGFGVPCGIWARDYPPLRELAYDSLWSLAGRGYVQRSYIERITRLHRTEHAAYYGEMIWVLMMLEQWLAAQSDTRTE